MMNLTDQQPPRATTGVERRSAPRPSFALRWPSARREGRSIGLVPTMGYLHEGHLSLLRAARAECDVVVMSLFVNPTQFGPGEDLDRYPRDEERDLRLAAEAGVDLVYAPAGRGGLPRGLRHRGRGRRRPDRGPLTATPPGAAPSTSAASPPSSPSSSTRSAPTSPTSARRTPSRWP